MTSDTIVRRQSSAIMAMIEATTVVRLDTRVVAVVVTVACMPPMSLAMRDCTSPVRVLVKKASDMRWRWAYRAVRRSCITRWPTLVDTYVCDTLKEPLLIATMTMPNASSVSSPGRP